MWVMDVVFVGLLVQEVEHVFDGQRQGAASVGRAEDGFKQIVDKLLQRSLEHKDHTSTFSPDYIYKGLVLITTHTVRLSL